MIWTALRWFLQAHTNQLGRLYIIDELGKRNEQWRIDTEGDLLSSFSCRVVYMYFACIAVG